MKELFDLGGIVAAVVAAYQNSLLQALLNGSATPEIYAAELGLDAVATERILDVLAQVGVAECEQGQYAASAALRQLDDWQLGGIDALGALWSQVPAFLSRGERIAHMDGSLAVRETAYSGVVSPLAEAFSAGARQLAERLPGRPSHILDVGAGAGIWSLAMAERHPETRVTALDLPKVLEVFYQHAEQMGLADRIETIAGDFHDVELPQGRFDRVVLANVLRLESREQTAALIRRIVRSLVGGGDLVIIDMLGDGTPAGERARAVYALHLAMRTQQGRTHALSDLRVWVEQAGLIPGEVIWPGSWPGMGALIARVPLQEASGSEKSEKEENA
jgi:2-polyprenyl-3-methyl-5-hydroxy-6-metoxy-1,4-benzoquinol methylase